MQVNTGRLTLKVVLLDSMYRWGGVTILALHDGRFSDCSAQRLQTGAFITFGWSKALNQLKSL
jgi:hypothetical protein